MQSYLNFFIAICCFNAGVDGVSSSDWSSPMSLTKGCSSNNDCSSTQACSNNSCKYPCENENPCGKNSECTNKNHLAKCLCRNGFTGNPNTICEPEPTIPDCIRDADCSHDAACIPDELGVNKCVNVCKSFTCGLNSYCVSRNHRGQCQCEIGFTGNSNDRYGCTPLPQDECTSDAECLETDECILKNGRNKCESVCRKVKCGYGTVCVAQNHIPQCKCPPGKFRRDPNDISVGCTSVACIINEDCSPHQACNRLNYQCFDVCFDACGEGAICIPENHRYNCRCPPGTKENPSAEILCSAVNLCELHPCHSSARCLIDGGKYTCRCPSKMIGDPFNAGCYPEGYCPNGDSDCPSDSICLNGRCSSPCDKACGANAFCDIEDRKPVCRCPPGFQIKQNKNNACERIVLECSGDAHCRRGVCIDSKCIVVCRENSECAHNERCIENLCENMTNLLLKINNNKKINK